jgi:hypothetical protein
MVVLEKGVAVGSVVPPLKKKLLQLDSNVEKRLLLLPFIRSYLLLTIPHISLVLSILVNILSVGWLVLTSFDLTTV